MYIYMHICRKYAYMVSHPFLFQKVLDVSWAEAPGRFKPVGLSCMLVRKMREYPDIPCFRTTFSLSKYIKKYTLGVSTSCKL